MNTRLKISAIGISLLMFNSCDQDESTPDAPSNDGSKNKIMSVGGSRVEGNRPTYESFRYELWKDLVTNNWTFDYIGTQLDNAPYPTFNNLDFDIQHEGNAGWTSGEILNDIDTWLAQSEAPDIVLFSSPGGNDALQNLPYSETLANINGIVDAVQSASPNVTIIIEQLAPARSDLMTTELTNYFNRLKQDVLVIASQKTTASTEVIAIDMFTGFSDSLLADEVHYNEAGADFIASRYYAKLETILEK